jgi:hypothetical protein
MEFGSFPEIALETNTILKFEKQKENYSGKKKMHTRKNIIISDKKKRIGYKHSIPTFKYAL